MSYESHNPAPRVDTGSLNACSGDFPLPPTILLLMTNLKAELTLQNNKTDAKITSCMSVRSEILQDRKTTLRSRGCGAFQVVLLVDSSFCS